jgi:hypothetical protein
MDNPLNFDYYNDAKLRADTATSQEIYLRQAIAKVYEQQLPIAWTNNPTLIPTNGELSLAAVGVNTIEMLQTSFRGQFGFTVDGQVDPSNIPVITSSIGNTFGSAYMAAASVIWNMLGLERDRHLVQMGRKRETKLQSDLYGLRKIAEQEQHLAAMIGLAHKGSTNIKGLFNLGATTKTLTTNIMAVATTPADVYNALVAEIYDHSARTQQEPRDLVLIAPRSFRQVANKSVDSSTQLTSIHAKLTDPNQPISVMEIVYVPELEFTFLEANKLKTVGANQNRAVIYKPHVDVLFRDVYPLSLLPAFTEQTFNYHQVGYYGATEVIAPEPDAITYLDFAK